MNYSLIKFLKSIEKLKEVKRSGWRKAGIKNPESVADHIYGLAMLSMLISDLKKMNAEKMLRLALIHDLEEAVLGDLTPEEKERNVNLKDAENKAIKKALSSLPFNLKRKYYELWLEYRNSLSKEAKLIKELDKLEMVIQALIYEEKFNLNLEEFWEAAESELKSFKGVFNKLKRSRAFR
jgi:putative hydrolase of HD superfamily